MKDQLPTFQIRLHRVDGLIQTFSLDDPFVVGAPVELTESDFLGSISNSVRMEPNRYDDLPLFLD